YELPTLVRPTSERDASSWPTPDANTSTYSNGQRGQNLREASGSWLTPHGMNGQDHTGKQGRGGGRKDQMGLDQQARLMAWPTPASRDYRSPNSKDHAETAPGAAHLDQLPNFVEHEWRTPTACSPNSLRGSGQSAAIRQAQGHTVNLQDQVY